MPYESAPKTPKPDFTELQLIENQYAFSGKFRQKRLFRGDSRIESEDFSGKTATAVKQDFHAKIFMMTLCAAFSLPIAEKVKAEYKADENRKYARQINKTNALANRSEILISVFLKNQFHKAITAFDRIVESMREIVRPNRNIPQNKKPKKNYSMNYKKL